MRSPKWVETHRTVCIHKTVKCIHSYLRFISNSGSIFGLHQISTHTHKGVLTEPFSTSFVSASSKISCWSILQTKLLNNFNSHMLNGSWRLCSHTEHRAHNLQATKTKDLLLKTISRRTCNCNSILNGRLLKAWTPRCIYALNGWRVIATKCFRRQRTSVNRKRKSTVKKTVFTIRVFYSKVVKWFWKTTLCHHLNCVRDATAIIGTTTKEEGDDITAHIECN